MRIVFMGTPDFAVGALKALTEAGHEILAVVTQPDKAKGRSGRLQFPPVKEFAAARGIPVLQPERVKKPEVVEELKRLDAEVYIVAAFGQILSQEILDIPPYGCLNIHASLLPRYRGASPIQHVILNGEKKTGITIMQMDAGLDTGDILYTKETEIEDTDTYETLHDRLMVLGGEAVTEALPLLEQGKLKPVKQKDQESCYAPLLQKAMGKIDFGQDAFVIDRQIRAMTPWPGASTGFKGKQLKIWKASPLQKNPGESGAPDGTEENGALPGTIEKVGKDFVQVLCGRNSLCIHEMQLEGKKRMTARDFLLGVKMRPGELLG